ncbi:hypothetical protein [Streptomyces sp. NRRL F-5630]|uniref:hypothetical protein n=1 Tax=Streptomyces sp. NRRL F-5630 TaxID=1463864 RepID=UPI003EBF705F
MITKPAVAVAAPLLSPIAVAPAEAVAWTTGSASAGHCVTLVATERFLRGRRYRELPAPQSAVPLVAGEELPPW